MLAIPGIVVSMSFAKPARSPNIRRKQILSELVIKSLPVLRTEVMLSVIYTII